MTFGMPTKTQDGLAAIHWAAIKGHKEVLKFLIEGAPENNRADPTIVDKDNWSPLMWAIFMAENAGKGELQLPSAPATVIISDPALWNIHH